MPLDAQPGSTPSSGDYAPSGRGKRSASPVPPALAGGIGSAAAIIVAAMLLSRVLGFLRQVSITAQFGVSAEADAWFAAFRIPDTIFMLLAGGALTSAIIPVYAEVRQRDDPQALSRFVAGLLRFVAVVVVVAAGLAAALAAPLMRAIAPGFASPTLDLATEATRWLMISPVLLGLSAVARAVLQARRRFAWPAVGPILYNLGIIFGALVLARAFGLMGLVWGTLLGAGLHLSVQIPALRRTGPAPAAPDRATDSLPPESDRRAAAGVPHPSPVGRGTVGGGPGAAVPPTRTRAMFLATLIGLDVPEVRRVIRLVLPRLLGVAALQVSLIYVTILASLQGESTVAALNNAFILMLLPLGVFAMSLGEASLPDLADRRARGDRPGFSARVTRLTRLVLFLNIPASVVLIVLAEPIVAVLFQRGAFDARATELTSTALRFFAAGLAGHAAVEVLVRAFFAMQDTRTPVLIAIGSLGLHMPLSWLFAQWIGLGGIALGVSVGVLVEALALGVVLRRRGGATATAADRRSGAITLAATLVMGFGLSVLSFITWSPEFDGVGAAGVLVGYLLAAMATYVVTAAVFRSEELAELVGHARGRVLPVRLR